MRKWFVAASFVLCAGSASTALAVNDAPMAFIDAQIAANAGKSGVYVLDTGAEALLARAWLVGRSGSIRFACEAKQGAVLSDDAHQTSAMRSP